MNWSKTAGPLILAAAVWSMSGGESQAQVGGTPYGLGYAFLGSGLYNSMYNDRPPYYAMFPPVYYSLPVARPYGYSPFAYPPGFTTPEAELIRPAEVLNPHVPRKGVSKSSDRTAAAPRVLINPFVERRQATDLAARQRFDAAD